MVWINMGYYVENLRVFEIKIFAVALEDSDYFLFWKKLELVWNNIKI